MRKRIGVVAALALVVAVALPASAAAERDSGWFYDSQCTSWTDPYTHAEWYGVAQIMGPGSSYYITTPTYTSWKALNVKGMAQGGYWAATGDPYLDEADTYAYCGDGTP